jgi:two-component system, sensor histidine kinase and response regulator
MNKKSTSKKTFLGYLGELQRIGINSERSARQNRDTLTLNTVALLGLSLGIVFAAISFLKGYYYNYLINSLIIIISIIIFIFNKNQKYNLVKFLSFFQAVFLVAILSLINITLGRINHTEYIILGYVSVIAFIYDGKKQFLFFLLSMIFFYITQYYYFRNHNIPILEMPYLAANSIAAFIVVFSVTNVYKKDYLASQNALELTNEQLEKLAGHYLEQSKKLEALNDLKNQLFSIISHDLKGPIKGGNALLELLKGGGISLDEQKYLIELLSRDMSKTTLLLDNLLVWAKSQLKGEIINKVEVPVKDLVLVNIEMFKSLAKAKNIEINHLISDQSRILADKDMIDLVLRNLIQNAIKFSGKSGQILISETQIGNELAISIQDNGIGMHPKALANILSDEPKVITGNEKESGTGLGLILCKGFIVKNNGGFEIESEQGKGTRITLTLPIPS